VSSSRESVGETSLVSLLREQQKAWTERPLLRLLYGEWHRAIVDRLAPVAGISIELGAGIGGLRDVAGDRVLLTDVERTPWVDAEADALALPYADGSLANIVLVDVFHHLGDPARFLDEADRTLAPGGRVVMVEPYCSPLSTALYRRFHHERTDMRVDPFRADAGVASEPFESNQALPTLAFYRHVASFRRRWPRLRMVERRRFAFLLYPLAGGFSKRPLAPASLFRPVRALESVLRPLAPLLAFRCLVVLERS
jgi:SAM-dependent methyltransferase